MRALETMGWIAVTACALAYGAGACGSSDASSATSFGGESATGTPGPTTSTSSSPTSSSTFAGSTGSDTGTNTTTNTGTSTSTSTSTAQGGASGTGSASGGASGVGGGATSGAGGSASNGAGGGDPTCGCFDNTRWDIDNLSPCYFTTTSSNGTMTTVVVSTDATTMMCPASASMPPTAPWSTDSFETDCAGQYHLCITLKAGDPNAPQSTDCVIEKDCVDVDLAAANTLQMAPDLPGWLASGATPACVDQFINMGGYGLLTADGTVSCGQVSSQIGVITYCPSDCSGANPPPACANCM
jgi:hypothetical protein